MPWLRKAQEATRTPTGIHGIDDRSLNLASGRTSREVFGLGDPLYPDPNFENNAHYGFENNELVYACVMENATSLPDAPFRVFGPDGQGDPREDHPLRRLIASPNPVTTEFELIELTSIYMDLAGIAFWEVVTDRAGRPYEIWPVRPDRIALWPNGNTYRYGYILEGGKIVPLDHVLAFKLPSPTNPALGQAPMRAANRATALDNEATDFVKSLLQNHAVPGVVIEVEQKIDEDLTTRLTSKWLERFSGHMRGTPAFLQKGMKVHTLGLNLGDLEFPDLRTISESRICAAFGVPPILVGAKVGLDRSTFANYAEARRSYWEESLIPRQKRMAQVIVKELMPLTEGIRPRRSVARFDNSEVLALKESEASRWETALNALRAGGITINEFCRRVGIPTKGPAGDVYLIPAGVTPVAVPAEVIDLQAQARQAAADAEQPADDEPAAESDDEDEPAKMLATSFEAKSIEDEPDPSVRGFAEAIAHVVRRQRDDVVGQAEKMHALLVIEGKAIPWNAEKWDREMAAVLAKHMRQIARREARKVDEGAPVEPMDNYIDSWAEGTAGRWNEATRLAVEAATVVGGDSVLDNVEKVFTLAATARALTLAVDLTTQSRGFGKVDTARRVGLTSKTWRWSGSANGREEHKALDGETVPVGSTFSNGQRWPGGPNCRCDVDVTQEG